MVKYQSLFENKKSTNQSEIYQTVQLQYKSQFITYCMYSGFLLLLKVSVNMTQNGIKY